MTRALAAGITAAALLSGVTMTASAEARPLSWDDCVRLAAAHNPSLAAARAQVIGLLPQKASSFHRDENDQILVPITTALRRLLGKEYVDEIEIQAASIESVVVSASGGLLGILLGSGLSYE